MGTSLQVYTDGGARGNPGPAASAFAVFDGEKLLHKNAKYLGEATNNVAEYNAVLFAITFFLKNFKSPFPDFLNFFLDSELVVNQLNGNYKIKKEELLKLATSIKSLEKKIKVKKITYTFVKREQNVFADKLVNICLDENINISR